MMAYGRLVVLAQRRMLRERVFVPNRPPAARCAAGRPPGVTAFPLDTKLPARFAVRWAFWGWAVNLLRKYEGPWPDRDEELIRRFKSGASARAIARHMLLTFRQIDGRLSRLIDSGVLVKRMLPIKGAPTPVALPPPAEDAYRRSFGLSPLPSMHPISWGAIAL